MMETVAVRDEKFAFQLDEFYLDLQTDGSRISLLNEEDIIKNPFPGLRPFKTSEFQLFKGRGGQAEELIRRLKKNKFLAVIGSSGTGKSSLVRAGLIPQLFGGYLHEAGNKWNIAICRPGKNPIDNLAIALSSVKCHCKERNNILEEYETIEPLLSHSTYGILEVNELLSANTSDENKGNLLVIVDQFEELFRFKRKGVDSENIKKHFVNLLLKAALTEDSSVYVILTMRSEFLGDCVKYRGLPEAINEGQYLVPQLSRDQLKEAIEGPINLAGKKISAGLVELLINEVEETKLKENLDQLPILQHALMRTYQKAMEHGRDTEISLEHYKLIGGMEKALAIHAEAEYKELNENKDDKAPASKKQQIAKIIFQALTDLSTDHKGGRRPVELKNIYAIAAAINASKQEVNEVIEHFRQKETSFIMPPANTSLHPDLTLDISHESLMRNWTRLTEWILEELRYGKLYKTLDDRRELSELGMDDWIKGGLLDDMLAWKDKYPNNASWADRYHPQEKDNDESDKTVYNSNIDFLLKSKQESEKAKARREDEIKREQREKSRKKVMWGFAAAAGISIALAAWGFSSREAAIAQKIIAVEKANEANEQRMKADSFATVAKIQMNIAEEKRKEADINATEANKQRKLAEENFAKAEAQKSIALKNANEAQKQTALALQYAREAEIEKQNALDQKLIAEKKAFESELKDKDWWNMGSIREIRNTIKDSLFNLRYRPDGKEPAAEDKELADKFEGSLDLLYEAEEKKNENWGLYLLLVKEARNYHNNFATSAVLDSLLKITIPFTNRYEFPYSGAPEKFVLSTKLRTNNEVIVVSQNGVYSFTNNQIAPKRLLDLPPGRKPVCISDNADILVVHEETDQQYVLYKLSNDVYERSQIIVSLSKKKRDNKKVIVKSIDEILSTLDTSSLLSVDKAESFSNADVSSDNNTIVFHEKEGEQIIVYDVKQNGTRILSTKGDAAILNLTIGHYNKDLLVCYRDSVVLVSLETLKTLSKYTSSYSDDFIEAGFAASDTAVWAVSSSAKYEWPRNGTLRRTYVSGYYRTVFSSPENNYVVLVGRQGGIYGYQLELRNNKLARLNKIFPWHMRTVSDVTLADQNTRVVSADREEIFVWDFNNAGLKEEDIEKYSDEAALGEYYEKKADNDFYDQDWDAAIINYNKAIEYNQGNMELFMNLGWSYNQAENYKSALPALHKALALDTTSRNLYNYIGIVHYNIDDDDSAIYYFKKSLKIDSTNAVLWGNLGDAYIQGGYYDSAFAPLNKALQIQPTDDRLYNLLGDYYRKLPNKELAIQNYMEACKLDSSNTSHWRDLGYMYYLAGKNDSAEIALNESLRLDSTNVNAWNDLGHVMVEYREITKAIKYYHKAFAADQGDSDYWSNLGYAYYFKKDYDSSAKLLRKSLSIDPTNDYSWNTLAHIFLNNQQYDSALVYYKKAIELTGNRAYWSNLSGYYIETKNYQEAIRAADSALKLDSTDSRGYTQKGFAYLKLGNTKAGLDLLNTAISIEPTDNLPYLYLACYYASFDKKKALRNFKMAIDKKFTNTERLKGEEWLDGLRNDKEFLELLRSIKIN